MKWGQVVILSLMCVLFLPLVSAAGVEEGVIQWLTKEELQGMLFTTDMTILDVRLDVEWVSSNKKIIGAVWENFKEVDRWAGNYPRDKVTVVY